MCRYYEKKVILTLLFTSSLFKTIHESLLFSLYRTFPYSLVVVVVCAQMRSDFGITPYSLERGIVRLVLVTSSDW